MWHDCIELLKTHYKLVFAALALWIVIVQFRKTQRWRSGQFITARFEAIRNNPYTTIVQEMLDWNESTLLIPYKGEDVPVHFTDEKLIWMLRPHKLDAALTDEEAALRFAFDQYINDLGQLNYLQQTGLLKIRDIKPFYGYWFEIIGRKKNGRKSERTIQAIHNYLVHYRHDGALRLIRNCGFYNLRYDEAAAGYQKPAA